MIKQKTARATLYDWHGGQWSATYAAASSGLIQNFEALLLEVRSITLEADRDKLTKYLIHQQSKGRYQLEKRVVTKIDEQGPVIANMMYLTLPWAN